MTKFMYYYGVLAAMGAYIFWQLGHDPVAGAVAGAALMLVVDYHKGDLK